MASERGRLRRNAFHHVAVARDDVRAMIDDGEVGLIEPGGEMTLGQRQANGVGEALPQRTGRHFDAGRTFAFGMAGRPAARLAKLLEIIKRKVVAGQVQQ